jgi:hypothetical protein
MRRSVVRDPQVELVLLRLEAWGIEAALDVRKIWGRITYRERSEVYFKLRALGLSADDIAVIVEGKHVPECPCWDCVKVRTPRPRPGASKSVIAPQNP